MQMLICVITPLRLTSGKLALNQTLTAMVPAESSRVTEGSSYRRLDSSLATILQHKRERERERKMLCREGLVIEIQPFNP